MKFDRKSRLLLFYIMIGTFAITCTFVLSRGTAATDMSPANSAFDDVNFYNCVVDAYNSTNNTNVEYTISLSDLELVTITSLNCDGNQLSDEQKIKSAKGIEKLVSLERLEIMGNQLTSLDVSENLSLTYLDVSDNQLEELDLTNNTVLVQLDSTGNPFGGSLNVYKGANVTIQNLVKLPNNLDASQLKWESSDLDLVSVSENGLVTALNSGSAEVMSILSNDDVSYNVASTIVNVVEIISDMYDINNDKEYILMYSNDDEDTIKENITVPENISLDVDLSNNKLSVKTGEDVLKEFVVLFVDFGVLNRISNEINLTSSLSYEEFTSNITVSDNLTYKIYNEDEEVTEGSILNGMMIRLYYDNEEINRYDIVINSYNLEFDLSLTIDEDNKYINYLSVGTTVSELLNKVNVSGSNINKVIYTNDKYDTAKSENDIVGSGDILVVYMNDTIKAEYTLSLLGDANGDGQFNQIDLVQMRKHIAGWVNPNTKIVFEKTGVYYYAIDMDMNGVINQIDLVRMRKRIAGVI